MVRKSLAIEGPIFGRSVSKFVFERLVFDGFILVTDIEIMFTRHRTFR